MTPQSKPSGAEPIGIDIISPINQEMSRINGSSMPLLKLFGAAALQVAIA
jgi:hypothetical protein